MKKFVPIPDIIGMSPWEIYEICIFKSKNKFNVLLWEQYA